uniref:Uncharacterized protein n=1 Tax=Ixodes ricinus TaxID=34613 RepID=A0A6B0U0F0_IXORI
MCTLEIINLVIFQNLLTTSHLASSPASLSRPPSTSGPMSFPLTNQHRALHSFPTRQPIKFEPDGHAFIQASLLGFTRISSQRTFTLKG